MQHKDQRRPPFCSEALSLTGTGSGGIHMNQASAKQFFLLVLNEEHDKILLIPVHNNIGPPTSKRGAESAWNLPQIQKEKLCPSSIEELLDTAQKQLYFPQTHLIGLRYCTRATILRVFTLVPAISLS